MRGGGGAGGGSGRPACCASVAHTLHAHSHARVQVFNTLYLQLLGFTDWQASLVAALFLLGTAFGAQARVDVCVGVCRRAWVRVCVHRCMSVNA